MHILVTGANSFVGRFLCEILHEQGHTVCRTIRSASNDVPHPNKQQTHETGSINGQTDWSDALEGVDVVVHLAARVHVMDETATDPLAAFRDVNTAGTLNLARQSVAAGVQRFINMSTIGVHGRTTPIDQPFTEDSPANPVIPYAQSKWEAEQGLVEYRQAMPIVTVRAPLIYGPGAPGNFERLVRWVARGIPLPLGAIHNRRSFAAVQNVADFLALCVTHSAAANQAFLVADDEVVSTTEFLKHIATAMQRPARLVPVPEVVMRLPLQAIGKARLLDQLWASLVVDTTKARTVLGWQPVMTLDEGLAKAVVPYQ